MNFMLCTKSLTWKKKWDLKEKLSIEQACLIYKQILGWESKLMLQNVVVSTKSRPKRGFESQIVYRSACKYIRLSIMHVRLVWFPPNFLVRTKGVYVFLYQYHTAQSQSHTTSEYLWVKKISLLLLLEKNFRQETAS